MGCDYGATLFIGVKLLSKDELFDEVEETVFGCHHKVTGSKYCPECGNLALHTTKRDMPKVELADDWDCYTSKPVLDGRFYVNADLEYEPKDVYVGVYSRMQHVEEMAMVMPEKELAYYMELAKVMITFLNSRNIRFEGEEPSIFVIPYISC